MMNVLNAIVLQKQKEVTLLKTQLERAPNSSLAKRFHGNLKRPINGCFKSALSKSGLSVIAEIKRRSPSKGYLSSIPDPVLLAKSYAAGGARVLSVLTDTEFFGGNLEDLRHVKASIDIPVLRKDFIIDEIQIAESIEAGADAILLMVSVLGKKTSQFLTYARELGIEALVEVHHPEELEIALEAGADVIGINHRDLSTFGMNRDLGFKMIEEMPDSVIKVAESGMDSPMMARRFYEAGFDAVLIGEALVKSETPHIFIEQCHDH